MGEREGSAQSGLKLTSSPRHPLPWSLNVNVRLQETIMKTIGFVLLLVSAVHGKEPSIVFDHRPEAGVPREALAQQETKSGQKPPSSLYELTDGTIKTVRIRYFNRNTWATEELAGEYVRGFLAHKSLETFGFQVWSQSVRVPEIECFVEFTDEYREELREDEKECREGRLLIWRTESCFRDATGRWLFVSAFDHFHRAHPQGNRKLAKREKSK
jgi:hypothetical protein